MSKDPKIQKLTKQLWLAAREEPNHVVSHEDLFALSGVKSSDYRDAVNVLISMNLFVLLQDEKSRKTSYRALSREDATIKGKLSQEEHILYSAISAGQNRGVWRKTLISQTKLHATVADKCLKKLVGSKLIKIVKDVMRPTRKVYMLYNLEPSQDITGGPWYTENEFDVAFIETFARAILQYIRASSFPPATEEDPVVLYPSSNTKHYPSAARVTRWLRTAGLSDTVLDEEHVRMLLDMLVYSGDIEALPSMRVQAGDSDDDNSYVSSSGIDDPSDGGASSSSKKRTKSRSKKSRTDSNDEFDTEHRSQGRKRKHRSRDIMEDDDSDTMMSDAEESRSRSKKRSRRSYKSQTRSSSSSASDSNSDSDSSKKSKKRKKKGNSIHRKRSLSPSPPPTGVMSSSSARVLSSRFDLSFAEVGTGDAPTKEGAGKVQRIDSTLAQLKGDRVIYRALQRDIGTAANRNKVISGWSQSPCGACPKFDFCEDSGPINPRDCKYYDTWLEGEDHEAKDDNAPTAPALEVALED